jgi:hypothetical protein
MRLAELPGAEIVEAGLVDLSTGTESVASLLVSMAASRSMREVADRAKIEAPFPPDSQ